MFNIISSIIFLLYQSKLDLKDKNVSNKLSWFTFYVGLALVTINSLVSPMLFVTWLLGVITVGVFFWKIKKWFPSQFGSGDYWVLLALQSLNPVPIAGTLITFSLAAIILFAYSLKTEKEIGFIPFLFIAYTILLVASILFF